MGEPACLRRSFSHPSESSREAKEGDPYRALGESISFGRFMSESLAWEKWSTFSHNRYLEEVERFSKPGSVAEKKAYFEAHYKRKAAERAAALLEAAGVETINVAESVTEETNCHESSIDSDLTKGTSHVDEQQENDVPNALTVCHASMNGSNSSVERDELDVSSSEREEVVNQESIDFGNSKPAESNLSENNEEHNKIDSIVEEKMLSEEASGLEIIASTSQKRLTNSSPRISFKQVTPVKTRNGNNLASRCKNFMQDLVDKKSAKSLHMSFHFSSRTGENSKIISSFRQKISSSKDLTDAPKVSANNSTSSQVKTKASVNGVLKRPSLNIKSEDRSIIPLLNKSVTGGITADHKQNSPPPDNSKSSNGKGSKSSTIISSPFRFRSEERAAKRREFYEKLEEKRNAEEAEKKRQLTRFQGKALQDVTKVHQSSGLKGKANEDLCSASQLPSCHVRKMNQIPLRQARSPIFGRKATTSKILGTTSQPSANTENSKCVENNRTTNRSLASRFQRNTRENASPNIQSSALKR